MSINPTPHVTATMDATTFRNTADAFTKAYVEAALWSSTDDNEVPLDRDHCIEDIAPSTLARIVAECDSFQSVNDALITEENTSSRYGASEQAGHDFWLTRNGHGCGFWDGDWEEPAATQLDEASKAAGECYLYVGDDGLIYAG